MRAQRARLFLRAREGLGRGIPVSLPLWSAAEWSSYRRPFWTPRPALGALLSRSGFQDAAYARRRGSLSAEPPAGRKVEPLSQEPAFVLKALLPASSPAACTGAAAGGRDGGSGVPRRHLTTGAGVCSPDARPFTPNLVADAVIKTHIIKSKIIPEFSVVGPRGETRPGSSGSASPGGHS